MMNLEGTGLKEVPLSSHYLKEQYALSGVAKMFIFK
jgi:hypothetical protein